MDEFKGSLRPNPVYCPIRKTTIRSGVTVRKWKHSEPKHLTTSDDTCQTLEKAQVSWIFKSKLPNKDAKFVRQRRVALLQSELASAGMEIACANDMKNDRIDFQASPCQTDHELHLLVLNIHDMFPLLSFDVITDVVMFHTRPTHTLTTQNKHMVLEKCVSALLDISKQDCHNEFDDRWSSSSQLSSLPKDEFDDDCSSDDQLQGSMEDDFVGQIPSYLHCVRNPSTADPKEKFLSWVLQNPDRLRDIPLPALCDLRISRPPSLSISLSQFMTFPNTRTGRVLSFTTADSISANSIRRLRVGLEKALMAARDFQCESQAREAIWTTFLTGTGSTGSQQTHMLRLAPQSEKLDLPGSLVCIICFEPVCEVPSDMCKCEHCVCGGCWRQEIARQIQQRGHDARLGCPVPWCPSLLTDTEAIGLLNSPHIWSTFQKSLDAFFIQINPRLKSCPNSNCPLIMFVEDEMLAPVGCCTEALVCECGTAVCPKCARPHHYPASCQAVESFSLAHDKLQPHIRICPSCKICVWFDTPKVCGVCECSNCSAQFCYRCGCENPAHNRQNRHWYFFGHKCEPNDRWFRKRTRIMFDEDNHALTDFINSDIELLRSQRSVLLREVAEYVKNPQAASHESKEKQKRQRKRLLCPSRDEILLMSAQYEAVLVLKYIGVEILHARDHMLGSAHDQKTINCRDLRLFISRLCRTRELLEDLVDVVFDRLALLALTRDQQIGTKDQLSAFHNITPAHLLLD